MTTKSKELSNMNMKSLSKHIAFVIAMSYSLLFCNTGCSTNRPFYGGANKPVLLKRKLLASFDYKNTNAATYYLTFYTTNANQQSARNQILNDLMTMIDYNYHQFENNLRGDKSMQELGADIATLGLTAASTVMGGAETKTILSAIATGVVGVNSSIDKEVFQNNTVQALQLQMRAMRSTCEANMNAGMKKDINGYPLQNGIRDIVSYYYAGSLNDALLALVQNSSADAQTSQKKAADAR